MSKAWRLSARGAVRDTPSGIPWPEVVVARLMGNVRDEVDRVEMVGVSSFIVSIASPSGAVAVGDSTYKDSSQ